MDSPINADIIAFASDLALAVNAIGAVVFALVMRRLWMAQGHTHTATQRQGAPSHTAPQCNLSCPAV